MDWNEVFYIADYRDMFAGSPVAKSIEKNVHIEVTEDGQQVEVEAVYSVMIRPNSYFNYAKHYQMNTITSYEACLALIKKYVTEFGVPEKFFDHCMGMSDGFRVESKPELERRSEYYEDYQDEISAYDDDIKAVIGEGRETRVIRGVNIDVVVANATKPGQRKLVSITGKPEWVEWATDALFNPMLQFRGKTKVELYHLLEAEFDVEIFNEMLGELKKHGIRSISALKALTIGDLAFALTDFVNDLE